MIYHILNGDCLSEQIKHTGIPGEFIICRECLIDGPLTGDTLSQFWTTRAKYISGTYKGATENYFHNTVPEFEKIINLPDNAEIGLWFENDLFCQANMWFILSLLANRQAQRKIFRIFPIIHNNDDSWKGFGISNVEMLEQSYSAKTAFAPKDIVLGNDLWNAYKEQDFNKLTALSHAESNCFQFLKEICQAHIDRFPSGLGRPERVIKEIIATKSNEFEKVFAEFSKTEGIYGFGDLQVKAMYDRLMQH